MTIRELCNLLVTEAELSSNKGRERLLSSEVNLSVDGDIVDTEKATIEEVNGKYYLLIHAKGSK